MVLWTPSPVRPLHDGSARPQLSGHPQQGPPRWSCLRPASACSRPLPSRELTLAWSSGVTQARGGTGKDLGRVWPLPPPCTHHRECDPGVWGMGHGEDRVQRSLQGACIQSVSFNPRRRRPSSWCESLTHR
ncbi:hypothetical protein HJG60_009142 [Phyllostomus discolor]|uniref:Uncharacterized protein n=1 Tax=Phyllostomus discolor TaxID=89673 RepID=A0A833YPH4_9CHIR|nr:hypothetical protein HJG60_009142 [Phyllostomus discolor]